MNRFVLRNFRKCRIINQLRWYTDSITPIVAVTNEIPLIKPQEEEPKPTKESKSEKEDKKQGKAFKEYLMYLKFIKHAATTLALVTVTYAIFLETTSTERSIHALESPKDPTLQNWESEDLTCLESIEFKLFENDFQLRQQALNSFISTHSNQIIILSGKHSIGKSLSIRYLARHLQPFYPTHMLELKTKIPGDLAQEISELLDYNQDYITNTLQSFNFIRNPTTDLRMVVQHLEKACLVLQRNKKHPPLLIIDDVTANSNSENLDFLIDLAKDFSNRKLAHFVFVTSDTYSLFQKYPKWSQGTLCYEVQEFSPQSVASYLEHQLSTNQWNALIQNHIGCKFQPLFSAVKTLSKHKSQWNSPQFIKHFEWEVLQQRKVKQFLVSENADISYLSKVESTGVETLLNTIRKENEMDLIQCCDLLDKNVKDYRRSLQLINSLIENQILYCNCQTLQVSLNL